MRPSTDIHQRCRQLMLVLGLCLLTALARALPSDRNQPFTIQADEAERDESRGTTVYSGSVVMEQGSMRITADKVIIHSQNDRVTQVIALGQPARYRQTPRADQQPVMASAQRLEYQVVKEMLLLIEEAALEQEGTSLSGNRIEYDARQSIVRAGSTPENGENRTRVRMVIPPRSFEQEQDDEGPNDGQDGSIE